MLWEQHCPHHLHNTTYLLYIKTRLGDEGSSIRENLHKCYNFGQCCLTCLAAFDSNKLKLGLIIWFFHPSIC